MSQARYLRRRMGRINLNVNLNLDLDLIDDNRDNE